ncbi:MAG: DUF1015 family protein, partial [Bacillota bacterium]|nr:DUF1015 family protein [Bacillota bacterium]
MRLLRASEGWKEVAEIIPFRGVRYNPQRIPDVARVVTPPYDVIGREAQERYYAASEYNVIRLILGKDEEGDDERRNKYTRAAELWRRWREEGILLRDRAPAVYVYEQEYAVPGGGRRRRRG